MNLQCLLFVQVIDIEPEKSDVVILVDEGNLQHSPPSVPLATVLEEAKHSAGSFITLMTYIIICGWTSWLIKFRSVQKGWVFFLVKIKSVKIVGCALRTTLVNPYFVNILTFQLQY